MWAGGVWSRLSTGEDLSVERGEVFMQLEWSGVSGMQGVRHVVKQGVT